MAQKGVSAEMPFLDHLEELRRRLFKVLAALFVGVIVAFPIIYRYGVLEFLAQPVLPYLSEGRLVYTGPADAFKVTMGLAFALGFIFSLPVVLWQLWGFVSPALYRHEKKIVLPLIFFATALFFGGVSLAFLVILPLTMKFLLSFQTDVMAPFITVSGYFGMATTMSLLFGAVFEMPVVALALTAIGVLEPATLHRFRRHSVVGVLVVAAFITPGGDPISLAVMAVPLYLLFEFSVLVSELMYRYRLRRQARRLRDEAAEVGA